MNRKHPNDFIPEFTKLKKTFSYVLAYRDTLLGKPMETEFSSYENFRNTLQTLHHYGLPAVFRKLSVELSPKPLTVAVRISLDAVFENDTETQAVRDFEKRMDGFLRSQAFDSFVKRPPESSKEAAAASVDHR